MSELDDSFVSAKSDRESAVIRAEIADLIAYLGGSPEHLLSSDALDGYKQRLVELDEELALSKPKDMQWRDYNYLSQRYAGFGLYELAATAAERAIEVLDRSKKRTLGITAIGAAAFWLKADNFKEAQRVCKFWIAKSKNGQFPDFATIDLKQFLEVISSKYVDYGQVFKSQKWFWFPNWFPNSLEMFKVGEAHIRQALKEDPNSCENWYNLGANLIRQLRYKEAISSFDKALEINPKHYKSLHNRGNALYNLQKYEEAISSFDKALEINPKYYYSLHNRGKALNNLQKYEEAISSFDKVLEINPKDYYSSHEREIAQDGLEPALSAA
jgi:tetratricopeptide (TPR) repeat protein